jgi:hypothetical protein
MFAERFHSLQPVMVCLDCQHAARIDRPVIEQHGARAAFAGLAATPLYAEVALTA